MVQNKKTQMCNEQPSFSKLLQQSILNQPYDFANLWSRAAESYPQNRRKQRICITIAIAIGVIIGALAMHFFSSPERWIRL